MKRGSILLLQSVIVFITLVVLTLCVLVLPRGIIAEDADGYRPILIGMYVTAVPFFVALYHSFKLLTLINANKAFSIASTRALGAIKYCGFSISGLYTIGMPYIFYAADKDDAPGVVLIGLVIIGASFVVATAAAVFQRLFQNAIDLQAENDLTV